VRCDGVHLAAHRAQQQVGGALAGAPYVVVRVVLVADDRCRRLDHPARHVAVQVAAHDQRHLRELADAGGDVALGVVLAHRLHRAVLEQVDPVQRQRRAHCRDKPVAQLLVGGGVEAPGQNSAGGEQRDDLDVRLFAEAVERPGQFDLAASEVVDLLALQKEPGVAERLDTDAERHEVVPLDRHAPDRYPHPRPPSPDLTNDVL
jgi:hypothetical protein